jgi:hypothetical protein
MSKVKRPFVDRVAPPGAEIKQTVRKRGEFDAERREAPRSAGLLAFRLPSLSEST